MGEKSHIIDLKKQKLREELAKAPEEQNKEKIKRLQRSLERHKNISKSICRRRKREKWKKKK